MNSPAFLRVHLLLLSGLAILGLVTATSRAADTPVRVLLVHGGHDFETNQFFQVFKGNPNIRLTIAQQPQAQTWLKKDRSSEWDVLVLYDMWQNISDEAKADFLARLKEGKGLVALHHSLCSYSKWDEYARMIGGRYHLDKWTLNGAERPASTYLHDVDFKVHVADPNHPITRGLQDFMIHDETYGGFEVKPESHVLLTTEAPTSTRDIAWISNYGGARAVYIQLGHDHQAYENPNYRRLVAQAIQWAATGH